MKRIILMPLLAVLIFDCKSTPSRLPGGDNLPQIAHDIAIAIRYKQKDQLRTLLEKRQDEVYAFNNPLCANKNCLSEALNNLQIDWKAGENELGKIEAAALLINATPTTELSRIEKPLLYVLLNDDSKVLFSENGKLLAKFLASGVDFSTEIYRYRFKPRTNMYKDRSYDIDGLEYICLMNPEGGRPKFPYPKDRILRTDLVGQEYIETEPAASGRYDEWLRQVSWACTNYVVTPFDVRGPILPVAEIEPAVKDYKVKQANKAYMAELAKRVRKNEDSLSAQNSKDLICLSYKLDGTLTCTPAPQNKVICTAPRTWLGRGPCSKFEKQKVAELSSDWKDLKSSYEFRREYGENPDFSGQKVNTCFASCMADCDKRFGTSSITKKDSYGRNACTSSCTSSCPSN